MRFLLLTLLTGSLFFSCVNPVPEPPNSQAYIPVYVQPNELEPISLKDVQPTKNAGKIYAYQNYIFQNEIYKGIHIIDNSQPQHPQKVAFLSIPFNTEMAIKDHFLYANYLNDLVVIDLQHPQQPQVVKRIANAFPAISQKYPPYTNVYFECPDPAKGIVVDWVLQTVDQTPKCKR